MMVVEKNTLLLTRIGCHDSIIGVHHNLLRSQLQQVIAILGRLVQNLSGFLRLNSHIFSLLLDLLGQRSSLDLLNLESSPVTNLDKTVGLETPTTDNTSDNYTLSLLCRLDLVQTFDNGEERRHTLALDAAQNQLSKLIDLDTG
ncbi:hypothetical protein HG530_001030 [Fusarium avenaceum]|nr:hypothetical protein HG530_001030 [Fusarium avenaceum]